MKKLLIVVAGVVAGLTTAGIVMASRNTAGTYTYPGGTYPVIGGTAITATWANNLFGDIQTTLTNSLDRNGNGGMLAPARVPDGTVAIPTFSWTNETGSGLYRIGAADIGLAVTGTKRVEWTSTGESVTGTLAVSSDLTAGATIYLTNAGSSSILKSAGTGDIAIGTSTAHNLQLWAGGAAVAAITTTPSLDMLNHTLTGLPPPSNTTDAANKGYVDGLMPPGADQSGSISYSNGWSGSGVNLRVYSAAKLAVLSFQFSVGTGYVAATLPVGGRPATTVYGSCYYNDVSPTSGAFTIGTNGQVMAIGTAPHGAMIGSTVFVLP